MNGIRFISLSTLDYNIQLCNKPFLMAQEAINLSNYQHTTELKVRFMDLDALQHVNNARYLNFLEEARLSYSQELLGVFNDIKELNILVARIEIDFMLPILFKESVKIHTRISKIGNKSFVFDSIITKVSKGKESIAARAFQTLVAFDSESGKTIEIPSELRKQILVIEKHL